MGTGTAANRLSGPGVLRWAPLGTVEPVDVVSTYDVAWVPLGYTESGSVDETDLSVTEFSVEEEYDPLDVKVTKRVSKITFALAEITASNLARVTNQALSAVVNVPTSVGPPAVAAHKKVEPGSVGSEVHCMLAWDADDGTVRKVFRECVQVGKTTRAYSKTKLTGFACEFRLILPTTGLPLYIERLKPVRVGS